MKLREARARGILRVRKPFWAFADDVLEIEPTAGVWGTLHSPRSVALGIQFEPSVLIAMDASDDWVPADGEELAGGKR